MIDTHCHLLREYYDNLEEVINNLGNNIVIVSGTNDLDNKEIIELCNKYSNIYGTIGIHPTEIKNLTIDSLKFIEENLNNPKIVGIGEIGLDYYWEKENCELQKDIFIKQLDLAKKYDKCVVVHSREAINDTYNILDEYGRGLKIDIHCFSSSTEMANKFIEIGCKLGIGGVLTFKNNNKLKDVVKNIDIKDILLETDSPFLTPEPFRGTKNQPANILYIAKEIAKIKGMELDDVLENTKNNAIAQFDLPL